MMDTSPKSKDSNKKKVKTSKAAVARRRAVLDAARELFLERGYQGTTIQSIATAAGYSKRTVYLDFQTKDEIYISLCCEGTELILQQLKKISLLGLPVDARLEWMIEMMVSFSRDHGQTFQMIFNGASTYMMEGCSEDVRERAGILERACLAELVAWVEEAVTEGSLPPVDPWEVAGILLGTSAGIILLSVSGSQRIFPPAAREVIFRHALQAYWRGLKVGSGSAGGSGGKQVAPPADLGGRGSPAAGIISGSISGKDR